MQILWQNTEQNIFLFAADISPPSIDDWYIVVFQTLFSIRFLRLLQLTQMFKWKIKSLVFTVFTVCAHTPDLHSFFKFVFCSLLQIVLVFPLHGAHCARNCKSIELQTITPPSANCWISRFFCFLILFCVQRTCSAITSKRFSVRKTVEHASIYFTKSI